MKIALLRLALAIVVTIGGIQASWWMKDPGAFEGYWFPVASHYAMENMVPSPNREAIDITMTFTKNYSCKFISLETYIESQWSKNVWVAAPVQFEQSDKIYSRPVGNYEVNWRLLVIPEKYIGHRVKVVTTHECHGEDSYKTTTEHIADMTEYKKTHSS